MRSRRFVGQDEGLPQFWNGAGKPALIHVERDEPTDYLQARTHRGILRSIFLIVWALGTVLIVDAAVVLAEPRHRSALAVVLVTGNLAGAGIYVLFKFLVLTPAPVAIQSHLWIATFMIAFLFGGFYSGNLWQSAIVGLIGGFLFALTLSLVVQRILDGRE